MTTAMALAPAATVKFRASSLPRIWRCVASGMPIETDDLLIDEYNEAAELGTAAHKYMQRHVAGADCEISDLAEQYGADLDELSFLCAMGRKAWAKLKDFFPNGVDAEEHLSADLGVVNECRFILTGTIDLSAAVNPRLVILEWKSGRVESDFTAQLHGYMLLKLLNAAGMGFVPDEIIAITCWLREGMWDVVRRSREQVFAWHRDLIERIRNGMGKYSPGAQCSYCPRRYTCEARAVMVRSVMSNLTIDGLKAVNWTPETRLAMAPQVAAAWDMVSVARKVCEDFRDLVSEDVKINGSFPLGDGRALNRIEVNRRELDLDAGLPVLRGYLTDDEIKGATSVSIGECEKALVVKTPHGQGAAMKRELTAALTKANAIKINKTHQLREGKDLTQ